MFLGVRGPGKCLFRIHFRKHYETNMAPSSVLAPLYTYVYVYLRDTTHTRGNVNFRSSSMLTIFIDRFKLQSLQTNSLSIDN